jgi:hypothetical protein
VTTFEESREDFIYSQFTEEEVNELQMQGLYDKYVKGQISFVEVCVRFKDQGI